MLIKDINKTDKKAISTFYRKNLPSDYLLKNYINFQFYYW